MGICSLRLFSLGHSNYEGLSNFPKIFKNSPNTVLRLSERFLSFSESFRRFPRNIQRCFDCGTDPRPCPCYRGRE